MIGKLSEVSKTCLVTQILKCYRKYFHKDHSGHSKREEKHHSRRKDKRYRSDEGEGRSHSKHHSISRKRSWETRQAQPEPLLKYRSDEGEKRRKKHKKHHSRSVSVDRKHERDKKSHTWRQKRRSHDESDQETTFIAELLKNTKTIDKQESFELLKSVAKHQEKKKELEEGEVESDGDDQKAGEIKGALVEVESFTPPIHLLKSFTPPIHLLKVTDQNNNGIKPTSDFSAPPEQDKKIETAPAKKKSVLDLPMPPLNFNRPFASLNAKRPISKGVSPAPAELKVKHRDEHYNEICNLLMTTNPPVISPSESFVDTQPLPRPKVKKPRPTVINCKSPQRDYLERSFSTFKIDQLIGEGTYGRVYKAEDLITDELVAMKYVRMEKEVEGFPITGLREIKILRELQHPNIVEFREIVQREGPGLNNTETFLVFEYMNHDLMGLLDNSAMTFDEDTIFLIFRQLLEGLNYCHKRKILHRDLKCSNILLNSAGDVKLADFGLGRQWIPERPYTNKVISLWYRPIELLLGEEKYGPPVDIWSLGCIFGELFQRRAVFPCATELDIINAIFQLCGTPTKNTWPEVKTLPGYATLKPTPTRRILIESYMQVIPPLALDLFDKMLKLNPASRISAEEALQSNWITFMNGKKHIKPIKLPNEDDCHELVVKMRRKKRASSKN